MDLVSSFCIRLTLFCFSILSMSHVGIQTAVVIDDDASSGNAKRMSYKGKKEDNDNDDEGDDEVIGRDESDALVRKVHVERDDGSGWVSVEPARKPHPASPAGSGNLRKDDDGDLSPVRRRRYVLPLFRFFSNKIFC